MIYVSLHGPVITNLKMVVTKNWVRLWRTQVEKGFEKKIHDEPNKFPFVNKNELFAYHSNRDDH